MLEVLEYHIKGVKIGDGGIIFFALVIIVPSGWNKGEVKYTKEIISKWLREAISMQLM